jgi:replicative DNA helicase
MATQRKAVPLRAPPHSVELEQALLSCCMIDGGQESVSQCVQNRISADSFYYPAHQVIFSEIFSIYENGTPLDEVTLIDALSAKNKLTAAGGELYLAKICSRVDTYAHVNWFIARIRDYELIRRVISTSERLIARAFENQFDVNQFLGEVEEKIFEISNDLVNEIAKPIGDSVEAAAQLCQNILKNRSAITGVASGFIDLDKMTGGFNPGEMIVIAARPSIGKSSLAMNIAEFATLPNANKTPVPTLFFSLEMSADQLAVRLLCGRAGVSLNRLNDGRAPRGWQNSILRASKELRAAKLWIDESSTLTIFEMRARARRIHSKHKLGLVIIDYLQLITGIDSRLHREQQIAEISRGVKAMAKELKVPVIVLSQLNRDSERENRTPRLSDLRESGAIEQDADIVLILTHSHLDGAEKDSEWSDDDDVDCEAVDNASRSRSPRRCVMRELIIAKQRNGPTGTVTLTFDNELTKFKNYCAWKKEDCEDSENKNDDVRQQHEFAM